MGDWGNPLYIVSQVFVIFSGLAIAISYLAKKKRNTKLFAIISANLLMGIAFGLQTAWVGLGMCGIAILRDSTSYLIDRKKTEEEKSKTTKLDLLLLMIWLSTMAVVTALTFEDALTWLGFCGTALFTISICQKNKLVYLILGLVVEGFWLGYNIHIGNLMGTILESVLFIPIIVGIITYTIYLKKQKTKAVEENRKI